MPTNEDFSRAESLFLEGAAHMGDSELSKAESCFRCAIALVPTMAEAHANLGLILEQQGDAASAETSYLQALALNPTLPQVLVNLGALQAQQMLFAEAEYSYRRALELQPDDVTIWSNLGVLYACDKRELEAESCYRHAMLLDDSSDSARFNLSYLLLLQGRFAEGWQAFEARDWYGEFAAQLGFPRWAGEQLPGKSILITCEAGHGDMIQFCRYASTLKALGARSVAVLCHPALKRLFGTLRGADEIIALGDPISPSWDYWCPAMSMPYFCATTLETIPAPIPYLQAQPADIAAWSQDLPAKGLRVGLAWKGNPRFENDAHRSLAHLAQLKPLWSVAGVHFVSLQKGRGEDEAASILPDYPIVAAGSQLADFADAAALIANLDLVISVDTAIAHLAGALGRPCWLLLPNYKPDWRWLKDREDSPWYPNTMRLFRQGACGDWESVITIVKTELENWVRYSNAATLSPPK